MKNLTHANFDWAQVEEDLPLYLLQAGDFRAKAESLSCTQAIAGESAYSLGCFFDDEMHRLLGLKGSEWQSLYHFTVGKHVDDARLETKPPYFHLKQ